jgi:hypothetical protein
MIKIQQFIAPPPAETAAVCATNGNVASLVW